MPAFLQNGHLQSEKAKRFAVSCLARAQLLQLRKALAGAVARGVGPGRRGWAATCAARAFTASSHCAHLGRTPRAHWTSLDVETACLPSRQQKARVAGIFQAPRRKTLSLRAGISLPKPYSRPSAMATPFRFAKRAASAILVAAALATPAAVKAQQPDTYDADLYRIDWADRSDK